ncbi:DUF2505 domain-containing protein [Ferrimonas sediminicola]|uniref:DUF2505 domain-containing protein n=1 Tax=Ferrimonas sediminicola TaxID=2569538 RepID=A0A4U1BH48_9GAMM|nr:DUF2505 domain-containing protein [Ferrimonas sediminicola]TKB50364.1 DUF2505 domain-containing protein [Ferrimonas sediminicola]
MKLELTHTYACSTEELLRFFVEPEMIQQKYEALGCQRVRIPQHLAEPSGVALSTKREVTSNVPAVLKRLLGSQNLVKQVEEWQLDRAPLYRCEMSVELVGVPIKITGTMVFEPAKQGCVNRVEMQMKSALPFIGNKLTRFVHDEIERMANAEWHYLQTQLTTEPA